MMNKNNFIIAALALSISHAAFSETKEEQHKNFGEFMKEFYIIKNNYYEELTTEELLDYAVKGMVDHLDPYSSLMKEEERTQLMHTVKGQFYGAGFEYKTSDNGFIEILKVLKDSPAEKRGLKTGDIVTSINNVSLSGAEAEFVKNLIKNSHDQITLLTSERSDPVIINYDDVTSVKSTSYEVIDENTIRIKINLFNSRTHEEIANILNKYNKVDNIALDLRGNHGGILGSAIECLSLMIGEHEIIRIYQKGEYQNSIYSKNSNIISGNQRYAIIVDEETASAAEVFALGMKSHSETVVIGEKTFGKGVIQRIFNVDGNKSIKLTIAEYHGTDDKKINGVGIIPDIHINPDDNEKIDSFLLEIFKNEEG